MAISTTYAVAHYHTLGAAASQLVPCGVYMARMSPNSSGRIVTKLMSIYQDTIIRVPVGGSADVGQS